MDPFTFQLLAPVSPPDFGDPASLELDLYLRSIGALPPLPMVDSPGYTTPPAYGGSLVDTLSMQLPSTYEFYDADLDFDVEDVLDALDAFDADAAVDVHPPRAAAKVNSDGAGCCKNSVASTSPRMRAPYDADIDASLRAMEKDAKERPSLDYLATTQGGQISTRTRAELVDAMSDFARELQLGPETLHRAVSYVDRFLSVRAVSTDERQLYLLGGVAIFVAAKYEDQSILRKLNALVVAWHCGLGTSKEVLAMESAMVAALDYKLGGPTAYTFLEHFMRYNMGDDEQNLQVRHMAYHLAEQSLLHHYFLGYLPSVVAASAIFLARLQVLSPPAPDVLARPWSKDLEKLTGYKAMDLIDCVCFMYIYITNPRFQLNEVHFERDP